MEIEVKKRLLREVAFWKWASPPLRKALVRVEGHPDPFQLHQILESLIERP